MPERTTQTRTLTGNPGITLGALRKFIASIPTGADNRYVHVSSVRFDHPTDPGEDSISVSYEVFG